MTKVSEKRRTELYRRHTMQFMTVPIKEFLEAKDDKTKRYHYCHCGWVRDSLKKSDKEQVSPTFCNCSAGWYRQYWEGILGKPVHIKLLKTLVKGDDVCEFEISLPQNY